jgi:adenylylsulfate kinase-like enzyme
MNLKRKTIMQKIKVKVSGIAGVGKSTIIQVINDALILHGLTVDLKNPEHGRRDDDNQQRCLNAIRNEGEVKIVLIERNTTRKVSLAEHRAWSRLLKHD